MNMALLTELSRGRVSAFGLPGCLIRDVDATGSGGARSRQRVSCLWTEEERFYGTRVCPGWYQGKPSKVPGESRRGWLSRVFKMLMFPHRGFGRASVRAECTKPRALLAEPPQSHINATSKPPSSHIRATYKPSAIQLVGTHKPPSCDLQATHKPPSCDLRAVSWAWP